MEYTTLGEKSIQHRLALEIMTYFLMTTEADKISKTWKEEAKEKLRWSIQKRNIPIEGKEFIFYQSELESMIENEQKKVVKTAVATLDKIVVLRIFGKEKKDTGNKNIHVFLEYVRENKERLYKALQAKYHIVKIR